MKRTLKYFNPSDRAKAEKVATKYRKEGKKVIIEIHPRWHTLDVREVKRKSQDPFRNMFRFR